EDPDSYADDYEFRTPLIIVTAKPPAKHPKEGNGVSIIFATNGVADAVAQAKKAAAGRDVTCVGGAMLIQSLLRENLVDELQIDIAPVILGNGLRLFENVDQRNLKLISASNLAGGRTSLIYKPL
ncbi:MAG: dihydrofolate reductase, partial [Burkholderiales bacterium]